jgi:hypothetical protein
MSSKQSKATDQIREHVDRVHDAIIDFRRDGISADGVAPRMLTHGSGQGKAVTEKEGVLQMQS